MPLPLRDQLVAPGGPPISPHDLSLRRHIVCFSPLKDFYIAVLPPSCRRRVRQVIRRSWKIEFLVAKRVGCDQTRWRRTPAAHRPPPGRRHERAVRPCGVPPRLFQHPRMPEKGDRRAGHGQVQVGKTGLQAGLLLRCSANWTADPAARPWLVAEEAPWAATGRSQESLTASSQ